MVSYDVTALFTKVSTDRALAAVRTAIEDMEDEELPVRKEDYVKLVSLCVKFGPFVFNNEEYRQHRGLAMGSPLSPVMASLYMEVLERNEYTRIMGRRTDWFRFVDDILAIVPRNTNISSKMRRLNAVDKDIQFTVEHEVENKLPFLDTLIWRQSDGAKFSVYRKPTNKDDVIHYFSAHSDRVKSGVVIGFFLRAFRICSEEYLEPELEYIHKVFTGLKYPVGLLCKLKEKALRIRNRPKEDRESTERENHISVPNTQHSSEMDQYLREAGVKIVRSVGVRIRDITKGKTMKIGAESNNSIVYRIPCSGCPTAYYGETGRGLDKRVYEHRNDVKAHRSSNSLVVHIDKCGHLPDWQQIEVMHRGLEKRRRKIVESAYISSHACTNHRDEFMNLTKAASRLVVQEAKAVERKRGPTRPGSIGTRRGPER